MTRVSIALIIMALFVSVGVWRYQTSNHGSARQGGDQFYGNANDYGGSDYSCGSPTQGEKHVVFKTELPDTKIVSDVRATKDGSLIIYNAVVETQVEASENGFPSFVRVRRLLSSGLPTDLIGKRLLVQYGGCISYPNVGEVGVILGIIIEKSSSTPTISPL